MNPAGQSKRLSSAHIKLLFSVLLRNENVFVHFNGTLTVEHWHEEHYRFIYRVLLDFWAGNERLPTEAETYAEIESYREEDPDIISESAEDDLEDFLNFAFDPATFGSDPPSSEKMEAFALKAGKKLLLERFKQVAIEQLLDGVNIDSLSNFFQTAATQSEILTHYEHSSGKSLTFSSGWDKSESSITLSTGLAFLDKYMAGGTRAGEAYGLMAPYGTCKTTLAVMLWCLAAEQAYEETLRDDFDGKKGLSFLVTYEAPKSNEIQHRALMYAARVHRSSLDRMGMEGMSSLGNDSENPLGYEKSKFRKDIDNGVFQPERERIEKVIPWLNEHTVCLDFTGSDPDWPSAGHGGVNEIVNRIKLELRNRGPEYYAKNVIIDYFGLMVDRDSTLGPKKSDDHKLYQNMVAVIVEAISTKLQCHTWVLHQLSGAANAMLSATKNVHHTDAKGSKSWAENLHFAFVIGNLNMDSLGQIACTKHRRAGRTPPSIIKVDGEFNDVFAPDNYHIDSKGQIIDKSTAEAAGSSNAQAFHGLMPQSQLAGVDEEYNEEEDEI
jgi:hypothetical protein